MNHHKQKNTGSNGHRDHSESPRLVQGSMPPMPVPTDIGVRLAAMERTVAELVFAVQHGIPGTPPTPAPAAQRQLRIAAHDPSTWWFHRNVVAENLGWSRQTVTLRARNLGIQKRPDLYDRARDKYSPEAVRMLIESAAEEG